MRACARRAVSFVLVSSLGLGGCTPPATPVLPPPPVATPTPSVGAVLPRWETPEASRLGEKQEYRLVPGDVVDIMVVGHEDMRKELPIRPDGALSYFYIQDVAAAGKTVEELRATIEEKLTRFMRYPQVSVVLKKARESQFTILGKVVRPGVYPINGPTTVTMAIGLAQGLSSGQYEGSTIEIADLRNSYLVRRNRVVPVNFEQLVHRGDTTRDVFLEDGDYIYIPSSLAQEVFILGEVFEPRAFGFRGRVTLLQAVAESGGFRPTARLGSVVIMRGQYGVKQILPVNVKDIVGGKTPDPELEVGDVVFVPRTPLANLAEFFNLIMPALLALQLGRSLND